MNRKTILCAIGVAALVAVAWFLLLWSPQGGKLTEAHTRNTTATATNDQLQLRLARLKAAEARSDELRADFERLQGAVPDDPALAQFILDANEAATDAGVDFLSIAPGVPAQDDPSLPPAISLAITVTGGYYEALDYLDRLSLLSRVVVVDTLALNPDAGVSLTQELTISLSARMFTTAVPPQPAPALTPTPTTTVAPAPPA